MSPRELGGDLDQEDTNTNLQLALNAMQVINEAVGQDIMTVEQEIQALDGVISKSHAKDLREYCQRIEEKIGGEYVRAGEKLVRLDLDKRLKVIGVMDTTVRENLAKVRIILARLRSLRSASSSRSQHSSTSTASGSSGDQGYRPYLELKPPIGWRGGGLARVSVSLEGSGLLLT